MAKGLVIPLTADIRKFIRGMKVSSEAVEDLGDEFRDVERKSDRAADDIERNFEDAADDSARAFEGLYRDAKAEFDRMERAADDVDIDFDVSENIRSGAGSAKRAAGALIGEVADELAESWGEAVRSGDYGEAIRDTFSNLAQIGGSLFGPVGAIGGGAASLILTRLYDGLNEGAIRNEELKALADGVASTLFDRIVDQADAAGVSAASQFITSFESVEYETQVLEQLFGSLPDALAAITQQANEWQLSAETVKDAYLGQPAALEEVNGRLADIRALQDANTVLAGKYRAEGEKVPQTLQDQIKALNTAESEMTDLLSTAEGVQEETAKTRASLDTYDKLFGSAEGKASDLERETGKVKKNVEQTPDIDIKAKVDRSQIDNLPTQKTIDVTARVSVAAATAKAQRLLDQGVI